MGVGGQSGLNLCIGVTIPDTSAGSCGMIAGALPSRGFSSTACSDEFADECPTQVVEESASQTAMLSTFCSTADVTTKCQVPENFASTQAATTASATTQAATTATPNEPESTDAPTETDEPESTDAPTETDEPESTDAPTETDRNICSVALDQCQADKHLELMISAVECQAADDVCYSNGNQEAKCITGGDDTTLNCMMCMDRSGCCDNDLFLQIIMETQEAPYNEITTCPGAMDEILSQIEGSTKEALCGLTVSSLVGLLNSLGEGELNVDTSGIPPETMIGDICGSTCESNCRDEPETTTEEPTTEAAVTTKKPTEPVEKKQVKVEMKFVGITRQNWDSYKAKLRKIISDETRVPEDQITLELVSADSRRRLNEETVEATFETEDPDALEETLSHPDFTNNVNNAIAADSTLSEVSLSDIGEPVRIDTNVTSSDDDDSSSTTMIIVIACAVVFLLIVAFAAYMKCSKSSEPEKQGELSAMELQVPDDTKRHPETSNEQLEGEAGTTTGGADIDNV